VILNLLATIYYVRSRDLYDTLQQVKILVTVRLVEDIRQMKACQRSAKERLKIELFERAKQIIYLISPDALGMFFKR
jgi:hypothetical protein